MNKELNNIIDFNDLSDWDEIEEDREATELTDEDINELVLRYG